uniref:Uncharacterized protein n=1 Tax=Kuenenia stuttgartiensis TaxID=174633 RepID=Q1Q583_KUEST|nr:unknown protein [Candidatus Kuenenia stuttgartiensis]
MSSIKDMGIDHRRFYIAMAQEFLDGSNIIATLQQPYISEDISHLSSERFDNTVFASSYAAIDNWSSYYVMPS